jgi:hypothetical protein
MSEQATITKNSLGWMTLKLYAAQAWPGKTVTELSILIKAATGEAEAQGFHADSRTPRLKKQVPRQQLDILAAKYAKVAPLSRISHATVRVNYLLGTAEVVLYYVTIEGEKKTHKEVTKFK